MSVEFSPIDEINEESAKTDRTPETTKHPWICYLAICACIAIFIGLAIQKNNQSWNILTKFGYLPPNLIWDGAYWGLITSAFVHLTLWHLAFNVYWLWILGSRMERAIGSWKFLLFFVASAFVSSSLQLATSNDTGIGMSGVVYAIFGFMWATRHRYTDFSQILDSRTIQIFVIWLFGCIVATYLKIWNVGNAAHISGLLFGVAVANALVVRIKPRLALIGLIVLILLSIIPLYWSPWSVMWLSNKAYRAHASKQYDLALHRYTQVIEKDSHNAWAYFNRSDVYRELGQLQMAENDLKMARKIDPSIGKSK